MFTISVKRDFIAQHYLLVENCGRENYPHSHHYVLEARIEHSELDQNGYLVDILKIESELDKLVDEYRDRLLNDHPEFEGLNPSIERFSRIIWHRLTDALPLPRPGILEIKLWENETCWAAYRMKY